jgi:hypothetical protein
VGLLAACFVVGGVYLLLPPQFGLAVGGHPLDPKRMEEFVGAPELAQAVEKARLDNHLVFVYACDHQLLGRLAFYAPSLRGLLCPPVNGRYRYPWIDDRQWNGQPALIVSRSENEWKAHICFPNVRLLSVLDIPYKKYRTQRIYLYAGDAYSSKPLVNFHDPRQPDSSDDEGS